MSSKRTSWEFGGAKGISRQETRCGCRLDGLGNLPRNVRVIWKESSGGWRHRANNSATVP